MEQQQQQFIQQNDINNMAMNVPQNQYTKPLDLQKLSKSSLRKYIAHFEIEADCINDDEMQQKVQAHFIKDLNVDPTFVLDKLLKLKKEERDDGIKRPTTRKKQRVMHFDLE